jgi:hypothetical protein
VDSTASTSSLDASLSWDNQTSWTAKQSAADQNTVETTTILGGPADLWGHDWAPAELANPSFFLRIQPVSDNADRDFFVDWATIKVYYEGDPVEPPPPDFDIPVFTDATRGMGVPLNPANRPSWGVQWGDYDNDGYPDLAYGRHQGDKESIYHNSGGTGAFTDEGLSTTIAQEHDRHGCVWFDVDKDHDLDFFCTGDAIWPYTLLRPRLYQNNGNGTFTDIAGNVDLGSTLQRGRSATVIDYDKDGRLDIVNVGQRQNTKVERNDGGWPSRGDFDNVSGSNFSGENHPHARAVASVDFDNDGLWDFIVTGEQNVNPEPQVWLYRNLGGGRFQDVAASAGISSVISMGHGVSWGDYDNDGDMDLLIGNWIEPTVTGKLTLFRNNGNSTFSDVTVDAGIAQAPARMGTWADFNNDGWLDLFLVNGQVANGSTGVNAPDQLYLNRGDGTFYESGAESGVQGSSAGSGDAAAWADYDRDGDPDLVVANGAGWAPCKATTAPSCFGPMQLFENSGNDNNWLELRLISKADYWGYGSKVWLTAGGVTQYRQLTDGSSGNAQNEQLLQFGLGSQTHVDSITIQWLDGTQTVLTDLNVSEGELNKLTQVVQPGATP